MTSVANDRSQAAIVELYIITSTFQDLLKLSCFSNTENTKDNIQDYAVWFKSVDSALETWNSAWFRKGRTRSQLVLLPC